MKSSEIRARFLAFFKDRGHAIIDSASLVTSDEKGVTNSTLFNTAGMQPLVPYLLGKPHPKGNRLVNVQKCLRTVDIGDIGDKTHATFFEMLGNWSLGDYFKKEAISWSYDFLTSQETGLGLDPNRLYVTVFAGDENAPRDEEAAEIWKEIFKKFNIVGTGDTSSGESGRIFYLPADKNWWEAGENGPCGPDTEMFYDVSNAHDGRTLTHEQFMKADEDRTVIEVWNDVFMQYVKKDGKITGRLPAPSVDTGAGLERLTMTLQNVDSIYETDLLKNVFELAKEVSSTLKGQRVITDHLRAATFLIADGVEPSNTDRGYILRRLIRRAIFNSKDKNVKPDNISMIVDEFGKTYEIAYHAIVSDADRIKKVINEEIQKFAEALDVGIKEFNRLAKKGSVSGIDAFNLFSSFGLPVDMTVELAASLNMKVDMSEYEREFRKHQELSRSGAEKRFKGGLSDAGDQMVIRYHTATHLLHQALHDVLGGGAGQKGSNITSDRLRFDFSSAAKLTDEQKNEVEQIVNEKIQAKMPVNNVVMPRAQAEATGARHFFGEKYGDQISIYYIGTDLETAYSKEFCGGPHVKNTFELAGPDGKWKFKIAKEEAVSQGVRRIKAVLE